MESLEGILDPQRLEDHLVHYVSVCSVLRDVLNHLTQTLDDDDGGGDGNGGGDALSFKSAKTLFLDLAECIKMASEFGASRSKPRGDGPNAKRAKLQDGECHGDSVGLRSVDRIVEVLLMAAMLLLQWMTCRGPDPSLGVEPAVDLNASFVPSTATKRERPSFAKWRVERKVEGRAQSGGSKWKDTVFRGLGPSRGRGRGRRGSGSGVAHRLRRRRGPPRRRNRVPRPRDERGRAVGAQRLDAVDGVAGPESRRRVVRGHPRRAVDPQGVVVDVEPPDGPQQSAQRESVGGVDIPVFAALRSVSSAGSGVGAAARLHPVRHAPFRRDLQRRGGRGAAARRRTVHRQRPEAVGGGAVVDPAVLRVDGAKVAGRIKFYVLDILKNVMLCCRKAVFQKQFLEHERSGCALLLRRIHHF